jgi:hypothetical protein
MMKIFRLLIPLFLLIVLITACATEQATVEEAVLTVGAKTYTLSELEAFGTTSADYTNKDGETTTYSGVSLIALLDDAGLTGTGDTLVFTAADGYQADMDLEDALACANCIVAIDDGSLRMVMPELSSKLQVKDVIEISVN